jgi:hypothetical protein
MEKNVLNLYLKKLASGDMSYADRVCSRLSNRLLFVPAKLASKRDRVTYSAATIQTSSGRTAVPIFTTEKLYRTWAGSGGAGRDYLTILGSDLCTALDVHMPAIIDPGTDHEVVLEPELVDDIAVAPLDDELITGTNAEASPTVTGGSIRKATPPEQRESTTPDAPSPPAPGGTFLNFLKAAKA